MEESKNDFIEKMTNQVGNILIATIKTVGLKKGIECKFVNDEGEEYKLTFKRVFDSKKEVLTLNNAMSTLIEVHKMLEIDFEEQTPEDQNTISSIVEMCDSIKEDYWMYKCEESNQ